jgi:hypothetical protein
VLEYGTQKLKWQLKESKKSYLLYLQSNLEVAYEVYKEKRKLDERVIRCTRSESSDKFISNTEHNVHG